MNRTVSLSFLALALLPAPALAQSEPTGTVPIDGRAAPERAAMVWASA